MKYITKFDRAKTIGVLQGLISQNDIKENPNRIPLADMHIEALNLAIRYIQEYETIVSLAKELAEDSYRKAMAIESRLTYVYDEKELDEAPTIIEADKEKEQCNFTGEKFED